MALIPKGALPKTEPITSPVNEKQQVSPEVAAGRAAVKENQQLRAVVTEQKAKIAELEPMSKRSEEWMLRARKSEELLELIEDKDWKALRASRKFQLLCHLLQGASQRGDLFGPQKDKVDQAIKHYIGIAEVTERDALLRGF